MSLCSALVCFCVKYGLYQTLCLDLVYAEAISLSIACLLGSREKHYQYSGSRRPEQRQQGPKKPQKPAPKGVEINGNAIYSQNTPYFGPQCLKTTQNNPIVDTIIKKTLRYKPGNDAKPNRVRGGYNRAIITM